MDNSIVAILFDLLVDYGVERVVCSPGSRNVSLLIEADARKELKKTVVTDERTAAFVALGMGQVSQKPVALICTSGTALLNYSPAIAEAYYQNIPLIVISADRPKEWIDQDDSQTVRQPGVYTNFSKEGYDIDACLDDDNYKWYVNRMVNEGLIKATSGKKGPVHFNVHLPGTPLPHREGAQNQSKKYTTVGHAPQLDKNQLMALVREAAGKKIMITAGFMQPDNKLQRGLAELASLPNVCVMAETISNLHLPSECYSVDSVLFKLSDSECRELRPDILISIGGALVSRKLKEYLRESKIRQHWAVGNFNTVVDCFKSLTTIIDVEATSFIPYFARRLKRQQDREKISSDYRQRWAEKRKESYSNPDTYPWSDLTAMNSILHVIPENTNLFLSNGTSVRYAQLVEYQPPHASFCNRGVSGIEGSTSSALGAQICYPGLTCLISGDLSFMYDIGALSTKLATGRFRVIVLSNGGGDIFRFINPTRKLPIRDEYLCADSRPPVKELVESYGWNYFRATDKASLDNALEKFFLPSDRPALLEVVTGADDKNTDILSDFLGIRKLSEKY